MPYEPSVLKIFCRAKSTHGMHGAANLSVSIYWAGVVELS